MMPLVKDRQYYKFCLYGFLKNLRFFDAFFLLYLKQKGLSYTEIGSLYALREIVTNLSEVPTGIFADTFGRKKSLMLSFLGYILSFVFFFIGQSYSVFFLAFLLYGLADAFRSGTHKGMIMSYLKRKGWLEYKIDYYGHTRACSQRGSAISALLAGIIVYYTGDYQYIFLISIMPYLLNLLLIWSYPDYLDFSDKKQKNTIKHNFLALWRALKNPKVLSIVHSSAVFTAYQKAGKDYIQPVMKNVAASLPILAAVYIDKKNGLLIGFMYFILYLLTARASAFSGFLAKQIKNLSYKTLVVGFILGIGGGYFFNIQWWLLSLLAFAGIYIVQALRKPILTGYLAEAVPTEILTSVLSAESLYRTLLTSILAIGLGFFTDHMGLGYAFVILSSILLIISVFLHFRKLDI
ncbi:MAG TPA: MFS transporter [Flavobacteriales bacterium]|nr:MFS transporter [Flavobacteriales bacterium]